MFRWGINVNKNGLYVQLGNKCKERSVVEVQIVFSFEPRVVGVLWTGLGW